MERRRRRVSCAQLQDVCRYWLYEIPEVSAPCFEGHAPLVEIFESVVDSRHAADRATRMIEYFVHYMRWDIQPRHSRCCRPAQVVQDPVRNHFTVLAELYTFRFE